MEYFSPREVKNRTIIWSSNPNSGSDPKEMKSVSQRDTCTPVVIAALFTVTEVWIQPKCLSTDKWIKTIHCIHVYIYYNILHIYIYIYIHTHTHTIDILEYYSALNGKKSCPSW